MSLGPGLVGRTFPPTDTYLVSREKIAEFNQAIGAAPLGDGSTAPLTFPIVVAFPAMAALLADPDAGIELQHVLHRDQRFEQARPVRAGDRLTATLTVDSVRSVAGVDLVSTRTEVDTTDGEHVVTAYATLVHRDGGS